MPPLKTTPTPWSRQLVEGRLVRQRVPADHQYVVEVGPAHELRPCRRLVHARTDRSDHWSSRCPDTDATGSGARLTLVDRTYARRAEALFGKTEPVVRRGVEVADARGPRWRRWSRRWWRSRDCPATHSRAPARGASRWFPELVQPRRGAPFGSSSGGVRAGRVRIPARFESGVPGHSFRGSARGSGVGHRSSCADTWHSGLSTPKHPRSLQGGRSGCPSPMSRSTRSRT